MSNTAMSSLRTSMELQEYIGRTSKVSFTEKPKPNKEPLYLETEYKLFVGKLSWTVITYSSLLNGYNYLSCL
ncbi:LOW QUALITY PROTEIN: hypothetical protein HID58_086635, partial [Brassica napus]